MFHYKIISDLGSFVEVWGKAMFWAKLSSCAVQERHLNQFTAYECCPVLLKNILLQLSSILSAFEFCEKSHKHLCHYSFELLSIFMCFYIIVDWIVNSQDYIIDLILNGISAFH